MKTARLDGALLAAVSILSLGIGCAPTLTGPYTCDRGQCPPGWSCWMADSTCHPMAERDARLHDGSPGENDAAVSELDAAIVDAASPMDADLPDAAPPIDAAMPRDAGMMRDIGVRDAPMPADSGRVTLGLACAGASDCNADEVCAGRDAAHRACIHSCASGGSCSGGETCLMGRDCIVIGCSPPDDTRGTCPENFVCTIDPMDNPACFPLSWL